MGVLFTTNNTPDIMLAAYNKNKIYFNISEKVKSGIKAEGVRETGFLLRQKRDRRRVQQNWVLVPEPPPLLRHGGPGQLGALHRRQLLAESVE